MPEYEIEIVYSVEYRGRVTVRAKGESAAEEKVQKMVDEKVHDLESFRQLCTNDGEIELTEEECTIEYVNEV